MIARRSISPVNLEALQQQITDQLKPKYRALLKHKTSDDVYAITYEEAVTLLASATRVNRDKTRFEARVLLQNIMNDISR